MTDRYNTSHLIEDQYEPGSDGKVLRNLVGITSPEEIAETTERWLVQEKLIVTRGNYLIFCDGLIDVRGYFR